MDREVWVVTAASAERRGGLLATWVSPASIDDTRPRVMVGISPSHFTGELITESRSFALHLLRRDQASLGLSFAIGSGRDRDKFAQIPFVPSESTGAPLLAECLAWLDCRVVAQLPTGDRIYYWAEVIDGQEQEMGEPLREREFIGSATAEQQAQLGRDRLADATRLRPLVEQWLASLPPDLRP
jgi:flavin reductase (DIM6/NTAB) family NADH-FMN oxidoreductase RutF